MSLVESVCPVCEGAEFVVTYQSTIADADADPAQYYSSSRRRAGHLDIVRCQGCGMLLTNPRDDEETIARVYTALADEVYAAEDLNRQRTAQDHLALVAEHQRPPGVLLDVGCATGLFVGVAQERGWQAVGLDASRWAIAQARNRFPTATFIEGLFEDVHLSREPLSAITMWDVLEHVRSPREVLRLAHEMLASEGFLYLNVPNAESLTAKLLGRRWVLLLREHLWYFSPETITRILGETGFRLVRTRPNFVRFSIRNVGERLAQHGGAATRIGHRLAASSLLHDRNIRFPIGEMNVVARKIG